MFREMRRKAQIAAQEECVQILRNGKRGVLAVLGDDGYPYTVPLDYFYDDSQEEGQIYFHCALSGHKMDAIRACVKVSLCVLSDGVQEENDWWYHFTSVVVFGRIRQEEDPKERDRCLRMIADKYMPNQEMIEEDMRKNAARAAILVLTIEHMTGKHVKEK